jgi:hypothetical protein
LGIDNRDRDTHRHVQRVGRTRSTSLTTLATIRTIAVDIGTPSTTPEACIGAVRHSSSLGPCGFDAWLVNLSDHAEPPSMAATPAPHGRR